MVIGFLLWKDRFGSSGQFTARQHDTSTAAFALQAYIRSQACDRPLERTTGMWFTHPDDIVKLQIWQHEKIIHAGIAYLIHSR
jgi:hypothetical protein